MEAFCRLARFSRRLQGGGGDERAAGGVTWNPQAVECGVHSRRMFDSQAVECGVQSRWKVEAAYGGM